LVSASFSDRNGSGRAEKWTNASPWYKATVAAALFAADEAVAASAATAATADSSKPTPLAVLKQQRLNQQQQMEQQKAAVPVKPHTPQEAKVGQCNLNRCIPY
jgi:hypothetical protein